MAKAPAKSRQEEEPSRRRKRESCPAGLVHVQASFNNTIITITDPIGQRDLVVQFGFAGIPRIAQGNAVRRAAGVADGREQGQGIGLRTVEVTCQRSRRGPRIGRARAGDGGSRSSVHQGSDTDSAQRMPAAEKAPSLTFEFVEAGRRRASAVNCTYLSDTCEPEGGSIWHDILVPCAGNAGARA